MMRTSRRSTDALVAESVYPQWFSAFLADRSVRKPSAHTAKAYRQHFASIAELLASDRVQVAQLTPADITKDAMRAACWQRSADLGPAFTPESGRTAQ